jgi:hypothetical protein
MNEVAQANVVLTFIWAAIIAGIAIGAVLWITKKWPEEDDFPDV